MEERYLEAVTAGEAEVSRVLVTLLFTDIVGSTNVPQSRTSLDEVGRGALRHGARSSSPGQRARGGPRATDSSPRSTRRRARSVVVMPSHRCVDGFEVRAGLHTANATFGVKCYRFPNHQTGRQSSNNLVVVSAGIV
jgi:hypothetical protein